MKAIILGGDGFIGWNLANHLILNNIEVVIVDKNSIRSNKYIEKSIVNFTMENSYTKTLQLIEQYQPDFVFNCVAVATPSFYVKYPVQTYDLDFSINYEIIKGVLHTNTPLIHFSTSEVYGKQWSNTYTEDTSSLILGPTHKSRWIYATSKILLEQLLYAHNGNFCIVRPQNFCGWDMDWLPGIKNNQDKTWIPRLPACVLNSLFFNEPIKLVYPGTQQRCYTYISDAVKALHSIILNWDKCNKQVLNIGNPDNEIQIKDFVSLLKNYWNANVDKSKQYKHPVEIIDGELLYGVGYEDCDRRMFSSEKITKLTNWTPTISITKTTELIITEALKNYNYLL